MRAILTSPWQLPTLNTKIIPNEFWNSRRRTSDEEVYHLTLDQASGFRQQFFQHRKNRSLVATDIDRGLFGTLAVGARCANRASTWHDRDILTTRPST